LKRFPLELPGGAFNLPLWLNRRKPPGQAQIAELWVIGFAPAS
jgi:hypothetical protein